MTRPIIADCLSLGIGIPVFVLSVMFALIGLGV